MYMHVYEHAAACCQTSACFAQDRPQMTTDKCKPTVWTSLESVGGPWRCSTNTDAFLFLAQTTPCAPPAATPREDIDHCPTTQQTYK